MEEPQVLWKVLIGEYWNNMEMKKSSLVKIKSFVIDIENNLWLPRRYVNNIFFLRAYKSSLNRILKVIVNKILIFWVIFFIYGKKMFEDF